MTVPMPARRDSREAEMAQKLTFGQWMTLVDQIIVSKVGVSSLDLPDCCYRDWYDDGATVKSAASRAIRQAKAEAY